MIYVDAAIPEQNILGKDVPAQATVSGGIPGISQIPGVGYALGPGTTCMCRKFVPW